MKSSRRLVSGTLVISARTVLAAADVVGRINTSRGKDDARCILLAEFFGPAAHGPLRGLLCARDNANNQAGVADLLLLTWGSPALVRGPRGVRGLLVDCGAAKMPAYQRLSPKFGAKARLTIGRVMRGDGGPKSEGPQLALGPPDGKGGAGSPP